MLQRITANIGGKYRREKLEGRTHLVVPCVMLKEGVLNGSGGPIFYSEDEVGKNPDAWNGMPIVIDHPAEEDGTFVSARQATVFNQRKVGVVLETEWDGKLKAEAWFDEERTKQVDKRVYNAIIKKKKMEVSTGLDGDLDDTPGDHDGVAYDASICNLRPDHLAVLPDQIGALSVADGGGLFANALKNEPEGFRTVAMRSIENAVKSIGAVFVANELSFSDRSRAISDLLSATYGEKGKYWSGWVTDVYDGYVIFWNGDKMWRQDYSVNDDAVSLTGTPTEVRRTVSYVANAAPPTEDDEMATKAKFDKKKFVERLIANGDATEEEREKLLATDEKVLITFEAALDAAAVKENTEANDDHSAKKVVNKKKQVVEEDDEDDTEIETKPAKKKVANAAVVEETEEDAVKKLPKRLQKMLANAEKNEEALKGRYVKRILNSKGNRFKEEYLKAQDVEVLEGMARLATATDEEDEDDDSPLTTNRRKANYIGNAGAFDEPEDDEPEDETEDLLDVPEDIVFKDPRKGR